MQFPGRAQSLAMRLGVLAYTLFVGVGCPGTEEPPQYQAGAGLTLDGTTFSMSSCAAAGQVPIWNGTTWTCGEPGKTYQAGAGLALNGTAMSLTACNAGQVLKSDGGTWACAADNVGPSYTAGSGLALTGSTLSLNRGCADGQVLKSSGGSWSCASDVDTNTTYTAGSGLALDGGTFSLIRSCADGQVLKSTAGAWSCASDVDTNTTYTAGSGLVLDGGTFSLTRSCGDGQVLKSTGGLWSCASDIDTNTTYTAGPGIVLDGGSFSLNSNSNLYVQNQQLIAQPASFNINGRGLVGGQVGVGTDPLARLHAVGSSATNGTGTLSGSSGLTNIRGSGTLFLSEVSPGDVIVAGGQTREVVAVAIDTLIVDVALTADILAAPFTIQKAILRVDRSSDAGVSIVSNALGRVGIGTPTPQAALDVAGELRTTALRTTELSAGGTTPVSLAADFTWHDFPDLSVGFSLPASTPGMLTTVDAEYQIAMLAGPGNPKYLMTRVLVDGIEDRSGRSVVGYTDFWNAHGRIIRQLPAGTHTIRVQYRTIAGGSNNPGGNDFDTRVLNVHILGN